jgi:peptidylprolyl isomerase
MAQAKQGDVVHVHYKGTLDDGSMFDSSEGGEPLSFTLGSGDVIPGFENAIEGMSAGDKKTQRIPVDDAYGERNEELVFKVTRDQLPPDSGDLELGDMLQVGFPDGSTAAVSVSALDADSVTLDANHPLAGKDLTFELELVRIE